MVEAIPVLIDGLNHPDKELFTPGDVAEALAAFGPRAKTAMPILLRLVNKTTEDPAFVNALIQIDPDGAECVPALIRALASDDYDVVDAAAQSLGLLGPRAKDAVPTLAATMTRDFNKSFYNGDGPQSNAAKALRRIGPAARTAIPALINTLSYCNVVRSQSKNEPDERDFSAAIAAADVLGSFRADAKAAVPALIRTAVRREKDSDYQFVRGPAILALGQIGPGGKEAVPFLRELMKEDGQDSPHLPEILVALCQLAPDGKELAEQWLAKWRNPTAKRYGFPGWYKGYAMVMGAMGRTSFETDCMVRARADDMDWALLRRDPIQGNGTQYLEGWLESFSCCGARRTPRSRESWSTPIIRTRGLGCGRERPSIGSRSLRRDSGAVSAMDGNGEPRAPTGCCDSELQEEVEPDRREHRSGGKAEPALPSWTTARAQGRGLDLPREAADRDQDRGHADAEG